MRLLANHMQGKIYLIRYKRELRFRCELQV